MNRIACRTQVVGWPPVRSYRKNIMAQKSNTEDTEKASGSSANTAAFVKVCMDGAPFLRKVDLKMYKSYQQLSDALAKMFSSFTNGESIKIYIHIYMHINGTTLLLFNSDLERSHIRNMKTASLYVGILSCVYLFLARHHSDKNIVP